jgi:carbamate kinase
MIGYHIQQAMGDELRKRNIQKSVATIITQVVVDKDDEAFNKPTKPIGPFYTEQESKTIEEEKGYTMIEDSGRGYRRVVASPMPKKIVEIKTIKTLIESDVIVVTVGGGGIPVVEEGIELKGVSAVIDKDLASEKLAEDINADILIMLTAVERVAINFGSPEQKNLDKVSSTEMTQYSKEGHFAPGSMLPKVEAGIRFVDSKQGRKTIITSLEKVSQSLKGLSGTIIE